MKSLMIKWRKWRESKYLPLIIILLTSISMFLLVKGSVQENTYDISLMNLAPETIRSVKTMEDPIKTEEEKDQAASEVNPVYQFQDETAENQATIIESIFDSVIEIKQSITSDEPEAATDSLQRLKKEMNVLAENASFVPLTDDALSILLSQNIATINDVKEKLPILVEETLSEPIRNENLGTERDKVVQKVRTTFNYPDSFTSVLVSIARGSIIATETKNDELTELRMEQARASVEPTRILQGQILVQKGKLSVKMCIVN